MVKKRLHRMINFFANGELYPGQTTRLTGIKFEAWNNGL